MSGVLPSRRVVMGAQRMLGVTEHLEAHERLQAVLVMAHCVLASVPLTGRVAAVEALASDVRQLRDVYGPAFPMAEVQ